MVVLLFALTVVVINCGNDTSGTATTGAAPAVSQFDGTYTGSWSDMCPTCGNGQTAAAGTFTATLGNGVFTNIQLPVTSGNFGIRFDSGTVSSSGAIMATGATPSQCSGSASSIIGQIIPTPSGGGVMVMAYSRPASDTCAAESGTITAAHGTTTVVSSFDGTYTGSWSDMCPTCGNGQTAAAGTFTATLDNGVFTNIQLPVTSGNFGIRFDSGTVSSSGTITATGATPSQCSGSASSITGQIIPTPSGGGVMVMAYSRPASDTCAAESGTIMAAHGTTTVVSSFDGTYTGSWSDMCPTCGNGQTAAAGTFTATLDNGVFTNIQLPVTSGNFGIRFDSGTVSSSGTITATGATPSQCSGSASSITGQIIPTPSGGGVMVMAYSRPASDTCAAESGTITAAK